MTGWMANYPLGDVQRIAQGGPDIDQDGRVEAVRELRRRGHEPGHVLLSARQFQVAAALCVASRGLTGSALACHGSTVETLVVLERLGVVEARECGALEVLYHLTPFGRVAVCGHQEDDPDQDEGRPVSGASAGPLLTKEVNMSTTATTPAKADPKPSAKKNTKASRTAAVLADQKAKAEAAEVPAVEDVTNAAPAAAATVDLQPVFDAALAKIVSVVGKGATTEKKKSYTRVSLGKSVAYVHYPSKKNVAVHVQQPGGSYTIVKLKDSGEIDSALVPVIEARLSDLEEKAAAKTAA